MNSVLNRLETLHLRHLLFAMLFQLYKLLVYLPILLLSTALISSTLAIYDAFGGQKYKRVLAMLWARINARAAPSSVSVTGEQHIIPNQSYVVVANHQSQFDILAIYGWLKLDIRWVMKKELRKVPFLGYACQVLGHVIIDRSNHQAALESINRAKSKLHNGTSIFFFPEGTRSLDGELLPFKKGAFMLARELGLPILPITIKGTREILPAKSTHLMPGQAQIIIHEPIPVQETDNLTRLMEQARHAIQSGF